jgi:uncharacterized protein (TIGR02757 family)
VVTQKLKEFLDFKVHQYNQTEFITNDPVCIPHLFTKKQDIEITGFLAATIAWGQRTTIIANCKKLVALMDNAPHDFLLNHNEADRERFVGFVHRTFNDTDLLYFIEFLTQYYKSNNSLEDAFAKHMDPTDTNTANALIGFNNTFFSLPYFPQRTMKHVATPAKKSACKRLNMFLRWMVRADASGVDFGLWQKISPAQLVCPLDTHVHRVAVGLGLLKRNAADWQAAVELTEQLKQLDPADPVKYDYALFGLGVEEKY